MSPAYPYGRRGALLPDGAGVNGIALVRDGREVPARQAQAGRHGAPGDGAIHEPVLNHPGDAKADDPAVVVEPRHGKFSRFVCRSGFPDLSPVDRAEWSRQPGPLVTRAWTR